MVEKRSWAVRTSRLTSAPVARTTPAPVAVPSVPLAQPGPGLTMLIGERTSDATLPYRAKMRPAVPMGSRAYAMRLARAPSPGTGRGPGAEGRGTDIRGL